MCEQIATLRRKIQRIDKNKLLVLDETYRRVGDASTPTLVLPGESAFILSNETSKYAPRFDMIACCTMNEVLPPSIYSPNERSKGITAHILHEYIRNLLAQAAGALDRYPLFLLVDRASIHTEQEMLQEFHDWGCQELKQIIKMPAAAAKRLSPLDNGLFNLWKQRVLDGPPLTRLNIKQRMSDAWNGLTKDIIHEQYRNCGFMRGQDPYFDCPFPALHKHTK